MLLINESCISLLFMLAVMCGTVERATSYRDLSQDSLTDKEDAWRDFQQFREWKRSKNDWEQHAAAATSSKIEELSNRQQQFIEKKINSDRDLHQVTMPGQSSQSVDPPPIDEPALMGRYIVNQAGKQILDAIIIEYNSIEKKKPDWTSVATISSRKDIASFPFVNVISFSDGPLGNGTGIPYMYLTPLDFTAQDIALDHRATLMMTLAQGEYCKQKVMDPMDPRCARIVLTGKIKEVKPGTAELEVAERAVFGRHPWLANMPADHQFFFAKLKIISIAVLDTFGGPKYVTVQDYLHPPSPKDQNLYVRRKRLQSKDFNYGSDNNYPTSRYVYRV